MYMYTAESRYGVKTTFHNFHQRMQNFYCFYMDLDFTHTVFFKYNNNNNLPGPTGVAAHSQHATRR